MAPSWIVKEAAGPEIFQPVKSLPLKRLVKPGSTVCAATNQPATSISDRSRVMRGMAAKSTTGSVHALPQLGEEIQDEVHLRRRLLRGDQRHHEESLAVRRHPVDGLVRPGVEEDARFGRV